MFSQSSLLLKRILKVVFARCILREGGVSGQSCWFGKFRSSEKKEMRILEDLFSDFFFFSQGKQN